MNPPSARLAHLAHPASSLRKNSADTLGPQCSVRVGPQKNPAGCSKSPDISPAQPRRANTRRSAGKAAASEEARRYKPHFVWPFTPRMDLGERISPASVSDLRKVLFNVELLSDARTPLADFFSVLLVDHSNRHTTIIQCGPVGSIDGRVAIAEHRTVLVERRLKREIDSDRFGFQRAHAKVSTSHQAQKRSRLLAQQSKPSPHDMEIRRRNPWIKGQIRHLCLLVGIAAPQRHLPVRERFKRQPLVFGSEHHRVGTTPVLRLRDRRTVAQRYIEISNRLPPHVVDVHLQFPFPFTRPDRPDRDRPRNDLR